MRIATEQPSDNGWDAGKHDGAALPCAGKLSSGAALLAPLDHAGRLLDLVDIMSSVAETAYVWDMADDSMVWQANATHVLGTASQRDIASAAAFHFLVAPEHTRRRTMAVQKAAEATSDNESTYRIQYRFLPGGRRSDRVLWLEDHGHVWRDETGRATHARGIIRVINERYQEEQRLLYLSDHDELTGQLNRIRLTEALATTVAHAERTRQSSAFLIVAINNLTVINETFGFDVGDEVIAATGRMIKSQLRGGDTIGRYSSNKFGILLNDCGLASMRIAAERFIRATRDSMINTSACPLAATVSIGGVLLPDQAGTPSEAISGAFQALDKARTRRSDGFVCYEPSPNRESIRKRNITIADRVMAALDEDRMVLALQPIMSAHTGEPSLYECLLRLERPDGVRVSAGEFIAVAEQLGLARLIDRRTLELAVGLLKKHPKLRLSLNVSGLTTSDHEWLVALHRLTNGRRQLTERLTIEITETAAIDDIDETVHFVDMLKEIGCRVAIDDFGAGHTSFMNLKRLNADMVKIDGSFCKQLAEEPTNRVFIRTLTDIAQTFGMEIVAEWVADEPTAQILRDVGVTHLQGFLYGQPFLARDYVPDSDDAPVNSLVRPD